VSHAKRRFGKRAISLERDDRDVTFTRELDGYEIRGTAGRLGVDLNVGGAERARERQE
jgi:hypothetical protein